MQKRYLPTRSQGRKQEIHSRVLKDVSGLELLQHLKIDTAINENILLAFSGFTTENCGALFCTITATDFAGGHESIC